MAYPDLFYVTYGQLAFQNTTRRSQAITKLNADTAAAGMVGYSYYPEFPAGAVVAPNAQGNPALTFSFRSDTPEVANTVFESFVQRFNTLDDLSSRNTTLVVTP